MLKGLVVGRILKYKMQNSRTKDYDNFCVLLVERLKRRGYSKDQLRKVFLEALDRVDHIPTKKTDLEQLFLKIPFDPNGPSGRDIAQIFHFDELLPHLNAIGIDKPTICYLKPKNLQAILSPTKFTRQVSNHTLLQSDN